MGMREWYWGSRRSSKRGRGGGGPAEKDMTTSTGCMCAVFQLFDFHQLQLANLHHPQQPSFNTSHQADPKGVEAPRNSLDSSEGTSLSSITIEENLSSPILKFQMGMQIKTTSSSTKTRTSSADFSSDMSSPGTKTPSLVARLMGLDLLPNQAHSPTSTSSSSITPHTGSKPNVRPRKALQSRPRRHVADVSDNMTAAGTRSLPETPRISSARRSDVDLHHRLSLQINKENIEVGEELDFSKSKSYKRRDLKLINFGDHENVKSPSHYARQIVKQVKESVSRKVGLDITNTTRSFSRDKQSRDELLHQLKSKNATAASKRTISKEESAANSCSPRLRFLESKTTTKTSSSNTPSTIPPSSFSTTDQIQVLPPKPKSPLSYLSVKPKPLQPLKEEQKQQQKSQTLIQKRRPKSRHDIGFGPRLMSKQQEEAFVSSTTATRAININHNIPADKKCKKTQLLLSSNVPTLLPSKKDPSPPALKIPQKQAQQSDAQQSKSKWSQLSSSMSQTYKQQEVVTPHVLATRDINTHGDMPNGGTTTRSNTVASAAGASELHQYVTIILSRTGIDKDTQVSFTNWFSPSHPLDPSIFCHLENSIVTASTSTSTKFSSQLGHKCNRKLLFHLMDEILVGILRPYINMKPWVTRSSNVELCYNRISINGSQLINILCYKIQSFPGADCQVLEDIDALIDKDMPESKVQSGIAFEEEGEEIVREVEKDILDTLIHETAIFLCF